MYCNKYLIIICVYDDLFTVQNTRFPPIHHDQLADRCTTNAISMYDKLFCLVLCRLQYVVRSTSSRTNCF